MRRGLKATFSSGVVALVLGVGAIAVAPAQQGGGLSLEVDRFEVLRQDERGGDANPAFVLRPGQRYAFRVHYKVSGADEIRTGHVFTFQEVATGRQVDVDARSFDPEPAGRYNEQSARVLPAGWRPGLYRLVWELRASAVSASSTSAKGSLVFLVGPPAGP